ncbi:MAG TPA: histidine phosphatase family protein [Caulobacteraceae bacterium]
MRRLILFRHAKAEAGPSGGEDFERTLTGRGRRDALAMGRVLAEEGFAPDLALVSSALRATQTWDGTSMAFKEVRIEVRDVLYNASPHSILQEIRRVADGAQTLMTIGHNPGLQELAVRLLQEGSGSAADVRRLGTQFPPATAVVFLVDEAGRCSLEALLLPQRQSADGP